MATMLYDYHSPSLKEKLRFSTICCFPAHRSEYRQNDSLGRDVDNNRRSPFAWLKSMAQDLEIRDKCCALIGRRGKNQRRHYSGDFKYDPTSYSLNFDDENHRTEDEFPLNSFTARLPVTPDRR